MTDRDAPGKKDTQIIAEGTMRQVLQYAGEGKRGAGVNGLDIPLGRFNPATIPGYV